MAGYNQGMIGPQAMPPGRLDPMNNNQPLQFNLSKGKPPMPLEGEPDRKDSVGTSQGPSGPGDIMNANFYGSGNMGGMGFSGNNMTPGLGGMMPGQMMGADPNMMIMYNQFGGWGSMGPGGPGMGPGGPGMGTGMGPGMMEPNFMPKEIMTLKSCVLYPPPPNAPIPTTRERPVGCRTAFVGGLPENVTEGIIAEVFENFGVICSIRKGKKNFCHIRYELEESVDRSLYLSGYRMKIEDKDDKPNTGRLHVDYAQARDDQYEWECKQRMLAREMRHRQRLEEERLRPPSPPPIIHYSDHEANTLMDKLKSDDNFMKASQVLMTWLERGDLTKRNINTFYTMMQCTNSQVRRLLNEKQQQEDELRKMKDNFRKIFEGILHQFDQIEKVFSMALKQRNWDHFSKAQRKNVELWYKQVQEIKQSQQEEFLSERVDDDMEMSDSEEGPTEPKVKKPDEPYNQNQLQEYIERANLRDENDSLKCQLEAYKNEVDMIKQENKNAFADKENQLKMLQQAMQGMQQQLIQAKMESKEIENKLKESQFREQLASDEGEKEEKNDEEKKSSHNVDEVSKLPDAISKKPETSIITVSSTGITITEKETTLLGLISCFLHVHPNGASVDYIWSYLHQLNIQTRTSELEDLLTRLPTLFKQVMSGVGATIERKWQFVAYNNRSSPVLGGL